LVIGEVYRTPSGFIPVFLNIINETIELVQNQPCEMVVMGGINLNILDDSSVSMSFFVVMLSYNKLPTTRIPTRVIETIVTLIDNILSSLPILSCCVLVSDVSDQHSYSFKVSPS
jgi:hypothetical protein